MSIPVDSELLLYHLSKTFNSTLEIDISTETKKYISKIKKDKKSQEDNIYYSSYALKIAQTLIKYNPKINLFSTDEDGFNIRSKKSGTRNVIFGNPTSVVYDVIPEKLMKICQYRKNSNIYTEYHTAYNEICEKIYKKIKSKDKYSEITEKFKEKNIYKPIVELVSGTLTKKRKCAVHLYSHLLRENEKILIKTHKKRFIIYDFGIELEDSEIRSFKLKTNDIDEITLTFNNGAEFTLTLKTNATEIKEHLSLKFHTKFTNMDDLFVVKSVSVK